MNPEQQGPSPGGCVWMMLSSVGSSLLGGGVGLWLGVEAARGKDSIFPVWPVAGLVVGIIAGPTLLFVVRYWRRK